MENNEIDLKKVLKKSILLSLCLSALVWIFSIFYISSTSHISSKLASNLTSKEAQAQNGQFESYFGTHVSAVEVKQLLSLVRSNNIAAKTSGNDSIIYINDYNYTIFSIHKGEYYTVEVKNDKDVEPTTETEQTPGADVKVPGNNDAGYYKNGYIRNIKITNNNGDIAIMPKLDSSTTNSTISNNEVLPTNEVIYNSISQ